MPLLEGKTALIFGVANKNSIAWAIAESLSREGARLALSYVAPMEKRVKDLAATIPGTETFQCDVQSDEELDAAFVRTGEIFNGKLDILVHSVAFAPKQALENPFTQTSRQDFFTALDISAYSLTAMARCAVPLMQAAGGGSIMTLTYQASERVMPTSADLAIE